MKLLSLLNEEKEEHITPEIKKLKEAAINGDTTILQELLQNHPNILNETPTTLIDTPLHLSCLAGQSTFAKQVLKINPELAKLRNSRGSLPLHVASAKGCVEIVKELVRINPVSCGEWDDEGRTPIHLAAMKGRVKALTEMLKVDPVLSRVPTKRGESVIHLCVKNNRLEALKVLVDCIGRNDGFLNWKDKDGNTALHIAVAKKQLEIVRYLLSNTRINPNARNANGHTTIDVLSQGPKDLRDMEIKNLLQRAAITEIYEESPIFNDGDTIETIPDSEAKPPLEEKHKHTDWLGRKRSALMVVSSLIATVAFQATLSPPGGFWQDDFTAPANNTDDKVKSHKAGTAVMATTLPRGYGQFMIFNTLAFLSSLSIILLLVSGLPMKRRRWMWTQMVTMWVAISALTCTYLIAWIHMTPKRNKTVLFSVTGVAAIVGLCMIGLVFIGNGVRMARWLMRKYGCLKEKEKKPSPRVEDEENDEL